MKNNKLLARIPKTVYFVTNENKVKVYARKPRVRSWEPSPGNVTSVANTPIEKIRILGVDRLSKCQDSWSIEFPHGEKLVVTTISTLAIESILTSSVPRNDDGWFVGPFSWAILNRREVTLIPTETPLGFEAIKASEVYKTPYLKQDKAVPGCVYQTRSGKQYAYLGTFEMDTITSEGDGLSPWVVETTTTNAWAELFTDGTPTPFIRWELPSKVIETIVGTVEVSDEYLREIRDRHRDGGNRYGLNFNDFKYYYGRSTIRRVGELRPTDRPEMTEAAWKARQRLNNRNPWQRY